MKNISILLIGVLIGVGLGMLIYFLYNKYGTTDGTSDDTSDDTTESDKYLTATLKKYGVVDPSGLSISERALYDKFAASDIDGRIKANLTELFWVLRSNGFITGTTTHDELIITDAGGDETISLRTTVPCDKLTTVFTEVFELTSANLLKTPIIAATQLVLYADMLSSFIDGNNNPVPDSCISSDGSE